MSKEYVDVQQVSKMLEDAQIISDGENTGYCTEDVDLSLIQREDVAPVIHAHWIHWSRSDECSNCGYDTGKYESPSKYCPACGAKMDEEMSGNV